MNNHFVRRPGVNPLSLAMLLIFLFMVVPMSGQFNFKIGYDAAWARAKGSSELIQSYNESSSATLNNPVIEAHWLHGINIGVRYRYGQLASELSWESLGRESKAVLVNGNNASEKRWYHRLNHLSFSQEMIAGPFALGASISRANYKMQSELSGTDERKELDSSNPFTSKIYLALYLKGSEYMSVAIKPYYRMQWNGPLSLDNLSLYLSNESSDLTDNFSHFGINISFYNGWQNE